MTRDRHRHVGRLVGVVVVAVAAAAGCARAAGDATALDQARQAYRVAADAVCLRAHDEIVALPEGESGAERRAAVAARVRILRALVAELRGLAIPPGDELATAAALDELERALPVLEAEPAVYGDPGRDPLEAVRVRARDYGFKVCGQREADLA